MNDMFHFVLFSFWVVLLSGASACTVGRFGKNCESTCHCARGDDNCDDGFCKGGCEAGWAGLTCQIDCFPGRFGVNCASVCNCKDGLSACDRFTGVCTGDCLPGFMGTDCQMICPHGTYGSNCTHACTCPNRSRCNRVDGTCTCEEKWHGTMCNESEPQIIAANDKEVNLGQTIFFSCTAEAIPEPTMDIASDGFPEFPFYTHKIEQNQYQLVAKVSSSNAGYFDFTCTAENKYGSDYKIITLSVITPPRLLKQPVLVSVSNTSWAIKWDKWEYGKDEGGKYEDSVQYKVLYRKKGSTDWLQVDWLHWTTDRFSTKQNLEPNTEYEVAVKCRRPGRGGDGEPGPSLIVKTDCGEPFPHARPQKFVPEMITASSVILTWQHPLETQLKCTLIEYILEYYLESKPSDIEVVDIPGTANKIELRDLTADSVYVFQLFPVTSKGQSKYFAKCILRTAVPPPSPVRNLTIIPIEDAAELIVTWIEPLIIPGVIKEYSVIYELTNRGMCWTNPNEDNAGNSEKLTIFSNDTQVTLINLHPYSTYLVSVQPRTFTGEGNATSANGTTVESIPDVGPPNLRLISKTSTSLKFGWDPIPCEQANGKIVDYEYKLVTSRLLGDLDDTPRQVKGLEVTIEDLMPHKEYGIAVRGYTGAGAGPFSEFLFETAEEDMSPSPNLLRFTATNTSLTLSWSVPNHSLGKLFFYRLQIDVSNNNETEFYYFSLYGTSLTTKDKAITVTVSGLQPATEYIIKTHVSTTADLEKYFDQRRVKTLNGG